jgi:hypothetical protein
LTPDDEQQGETQETSVSNKIVDPDPAFQDTSETEAITRAQAEGSSEHAEGAAGPAPTPEEAAPGPSPAEAQRLGEGLPPGEGTTSPAPVQPGTGTGPGGAIRGGQSFGATGQSGEVRGPQSTGSAGGQSPAEAQRRGEEQASDAFSERPHVFVAGAFVGGLVLAQILKRLGGGDD